MNRNWKRISKLEEQLRVRKPKKPASINIVMVEEKSIRTAENLLVRLPDETPFPEGFAVTHESILPDGATYRVWKHKRP
jgi:hypothetical protein